MKKKVIAMLMATVMTAGFLAGCGGADQAASDEAEEDVVVEEAGDEKASDDSAEFEESDGSYVIGISQFAEHGSLDNCREGFLKGLEAEGIVEGENLEILFDNAQTDMSTASTIADSYISKKVDLICGIATPSAMTAYNSASAAGIPVIYTAVTDPVAAELAAEDGTPVGEVTGTSDKLPIEDQLKMIRELQPDAKKIGILFTTSETNSESAVAEYKELAGDYGFEIVDKGINTIADVSMAAADLAGKVDCISNLTDNTVVSALQTVIDAANKNNIPVYGSEVEQVKAGCVASMGIEYVSLGEQTGKMAAKVLKGEAKASEMPFEMISESSCYVNTAAAEKLGMEISEDFVSGADEVFEEIVVE